MPKLADTSSRDILNLQDQLRLALKEAQSVEEAAQWLAEMFFNQFGDSVVLARCFVTIPYQSLPQTNREFVQNLARQRGVEDLLQGETLVLSLMGTYGINPDWNRRQLSQGHIGIPLISSAFVDSIPMVARLLKELEIDLEWLDGQDMSFVERKQGVGWVSVFYVRDAATATDSQGRYIIAAQDFVAENNIETVFGMGGIYGDGTILSMLVFTRDEIEKEEVEAFIPLITTIRATTSHLVKSNRFFK